MSRKKIDGVIEAVRYLPEGGIECVRLFEWRGAVWSDHSILMRSELVAQIQAGKKFVTGKRTAYYGSQFETGASVRIDNGFLTAGSQRATSDLMDGAAIF